MESLTSTFIVGKKGLECCYQLKASSIRAMAFLGTMEGLGVCILRTCNLNECALKNKKRKVGRI
jgi:hypothetical protein